MHVKVLCVNEKTLCKCELLLKNVNHLGPIPFLNQSRKEK